jgi:hypothetical protein
LSFSPWSDNRILGKKKAPARMRRGFFYSIKRVSP